MHCNARGRAMPAMGARGPQHAPPMRPQERPRTGNKSVDTWVWGHSFALKTETGRTVNICVPLRGWGDVIRAP
eukprot:9495940-Pyramimonas_sp.AAC.1